jgi:hypothetical protein
MYSSIWRGVFLSKFLFVTDPKPKFGWRVFGGPRSSKTFHVLGAPKIFTKTLQCCWGCLDLAMPLGLSNFQIYFTILENLYLRRLYLQRLPIIVESYYRANGFSVPPRHGVFPDSPCLLACPTLHAIVGRLLPLHRSQFWENMFSTPPLSGGKHARVHHSRCRLVEQVCLCF